MKLIYAGLSELRWSFCRVAHDRFVANCVVCEFTRMVTNILRISPIYLGKFCKRTMGIFVNNRDNCVTVLYMLFVEHFEPVFHCKLYELASVLEAAAEKEIILSTVCW